MGLMLQRIVESEKREALHSDSGGGAGSGTSYKVELDGNFYKLRCCDTPEMAEEIEQNCRAIQGLGIIPMFYGRHGNSLVFDFVGGTDLERNISPKDAYHLGQLLGRINTVPVGAVDFDAIFSEGLNELCEYWIFGPEQRKQIIKAYEEKKPWHILTGLNYSDVRWHNFRKRKDGIIVAVDDEALKTMYPVGSSLVKAVDKWMAGEELSSLLEGYGSISKDNLDFYLQNKQFIHLYFWMRFAKVQLHSERGTAEERKEKLDKAVKRILDYTSSSFASNTCS